MADTTAAILQGDSGKAYRMYQAAFDRAPDAGGLRYYINELSSGRLTLKAMAVGFYNSPEFKSRYGTNVTSEQFVRLLYRNVLGREPDDAGLQFHKANLDAGRLDFPDTLASFSESPENATRIAGSVQKLWSVSAGALHTVALRGDGAVWTWGYGEYGQLGDGTSGRGAVRSSPIKVAQDFIKVSAGGYHTAGVKTDGTLWTWGENRFGQLGDGTTTNRSRPVYVGNGYVSVAAGAITTLALKLDGTVWWWGGTWQNNTYVANTRPQQAPVGSGFVAIANGASMMALHADGSLWIWGYEPFSGEMIAAPYKVLDSVVAIDSNTSTNLAIKRDGSLWVWGRYPGISGAGSDGGFVARPTLVGTGYKKIVSGEGVGGIKTDNSLWFWGNNLNGKYGLPYTGRGIELPTKAADNVADASVGNGHSVVALNDGTIQTAGSNTFGRLGNGQVETSDTVWQDALRPVPTIAENASNQSVANTTPPSSSTGTGTGTGGTGTGTGGGTTPTCATLTTYSRYLFVQGDKALQASYGFIEGDGTDPRRTTATMCIRYTVNTGDRIHKDINGNPLGEGYLLETYASNARRTYLFMNTLAFPRTHTVTITNRQVRWTDGSYLKFSADRGIVLMQSTPQGERDFDQVWNTVCVDNKFAGSDANRCNIAAGDWTTIR